MLYRFTSASHSYNINPGCLKQKYVPVVNCMNDSHDCNIYIFQDCGIIKIDISISLRSIMNTQEIEIRSLLICFIVEAI